MLRQAQIFVGALVFIFGIARGAQAQVQVVPPGDDVAGQSQLYWAQAWWQWIWSVPAANNPLNDPTGQFAGENNNGPVFFLAGNAGGSSTRTIYVPDGTPVFFPVINSFFVPINLDGTYNPSPCSSPLTLACAIQATSFTQVTGLEVDIDGTPVDNVEQYRQTSTSFFSISLPDDNLYGIPTVAYNQCVSDAGVACSNLWTQDGFYVALDNLTPGTYVLHFQGAGESVAGGPISLDVTDTLIVVPEVSTWAMTLMGGVGLLLAAARAKRRPRFGAALPHG